MDSLFAIQYLKYGIDNGENQLDLMLHRLVTIFAVIDICQVFLYGKIFINTWFLKLYTEFLQGQVILYD